MSDIRRQHSLIIRSIWSTPLLFLIFIGVTILSSCKEETVDASPLYGKWNVYDATRDGRRTSTLKDAYFHFVNDTLLLTNILTEEQSFTYRFTGDKISVSGPLSTTYIVSMRGKDSLNLYADIKGYDFGFFTMRDSSSAVEGIEEVPVQ